MAALHYNSWKQIENAIYNKIYDALDDMNAEPTVFA